MNQASTIRVHILTASALIISGACFLTGCDGEEPVQVEQPPQAEATPDPGQATASDSGTASLNEADLDAPPPTPGLAVLPFTHKGNITEADAGEILADLLTLQTVTDTYELHQSYELRSTLNDLGLEVSDLTNNNESIRRLGLETSIRFLISGELSRLGSTYYLSAQLVECATGRVVSTGKIDFQSFDKAPAHLDALASQLELNNSRYEPLPEPSADTAAETLPSYDRIEALYLKGELTVEQAHMGIRLLKADATALNKSDRKRLAYYLTVAEGTLQADKLQRALDLIDASEQSQAQDAEQKIQAERQSRIAALLDHAKANDNKADAQAAIQSLDELLEIDPDHVEAQLLRANIGLYALPAKVGDTWTNSIGMTFAYIPRGSFMMGSGLTPDQINQKLQINPDPLKNYGLPQHKVTLTKPFVLGTTEVTREQFTKFVNATGYRTSAEVKGHSKTFTTEQWTDQRSVYWNEPGIEQGQDNPVAHISWQDSTAFCAWLSEREGRRYRLPTEAEWEYACLAGSTGPWSWGDTADDGEHYANMSDQSANQWINKLGHTFDNLEATWDDQYVYTAPVGRFKPNAWGLYDMHGNISEWCSDRYGTYNEINKTDPQGPGSGDRRVLRGGSWLTDPWRCRAARRQGFDTDYSGFHFGFRIAVDLEIQRSR